MEDPLEALEQISYTFDKMDINNYYKQYYFAHRI